ncbi:hypothetical protein FEM48_Zijuj10G0120200 [Ziziphus jujuba var. spinosa]|uniref:Uncharacterized protein n=1 Tax=Ziziphus jujuba var. spinosa TaxID=714518 RepID=A0A978UN94_ZIZJJ|nr:hypothetical protein FEM48_Zijuj10G0120200 [Ziziphus jujuba var. spinosa]
MDYMNMDDRSIGMFWVVSYTMEQPASETVMNWLSSGGVTELLGPNPQSNERLMVMREVSPLPMSLLSGFSMNLCLKLANEMEESLFSGQHLARSNLAVLSRPGFFLLVLEILNYLLLPLYRYRGKSKALMYDITKIASALKGKRGDHHGPTEFAETLNRITVLTLAIVIKTRGVTDADHLLYFPSVLRDALIGRMDKRDLAIQARQQVHYCPFQFY